MKIETYGYTPPSPQELRAILKQLNLKQDAACRLIGITRRTITRYLAQSVESSSIPYPMLFTLIARSGWGMIHPDTWRIQIAHHTTNLSKL